MSGRGRRERGPEGGAYPRGANLGDEEDGDAETGAEADEGGDADRDGLLVKLGELGELDSLRRESRVGGRAGQIDRDRDRRARVWSEGTPASDPRERGSGARGALGHDARC